MGGRKSTSIESQLRRAARAALLATLCSLAGHVVMQGIYFIAPILIETFDIWLRPPSNIYTIPIGRTLIVGSSALWLLFVVLLARVVPDCACLRWLARLLLLVAIAAVLWRLTTLFECYLLLTGDGFPDRIRGTVSLIGLVAYWMRPVFFITVGVLVYATLRVKQPRPRGVRWHVVVLVVTGVAAWTLACIIEQSMADISLDEYPESEAQLEWVYLAWGYGQVIPSLAWRLWLAYVALRTWRWREKPTATDEQQAI